MATVWAKSSGSWNTLTLWAFWNENTQQIEDYGKTPQLNDIVYFNGYDVTCPNESVSVGEIHNDLNPYTNRSGGRGVNIPPVITAEKFVSVNYLFNAGYGFENVINGDIFVYSYAPLQRSSGPALNYSINGNVYLYNNSSLVIGNSTNDKKIIINGNFYTESSEQVFLSHDVLINGNISIKDAVFNGMSLTINGNVNYNNSFVNFPLQFKNLIINNVDTFKFIDERVERINPFVIITNAELNNRQQYPQESDVKNGVEYAYGLKEGNYTPNFPQEANVLKGVEYDDGNKVGTLEVIALSGATATAENISVVNLTEQEVERVKNCATVSTVQKCFEDFKEE